jgi:hypothetical protein
MKEIRCFFVVESGRTKRSLRRYKSSDKEQDKCSASGYGYHNAHTPIEDGAHEPGTYISNDSPVAFEGDERWPTHCACGYEFRPEDQRQVFSESIYRNEATGDEWPMRELPPGAMYDAWWYRDDDGKPRRGTGMGTGTGHDGICLCVCLPPGGGLDYWHVDAVAKNGPGWERTGTVPNITATPSIQTPRYHGWLRNGVLVEC